MIVDPKILFFVVILLVFSQQARAGSVSSEDLLKRSAEFDGKAIVYSGEIIGDIMRRKGSVLVNVYDGRNALGVYLPLSAAGVISAAGDYKTAGDIVEITGEFRRVCAEHGGDTDIHASGVKLISRGSIKKRSIDGAKKILVFKLLGALVIIWILSRLKIR